MPELPELLTIKQAMSNVIRGKTFAKIEIKKATIIKNIEMTDFEKTLQNETINAIEYENNCLVFLLSNNKVLISSPKQNGNFCFYDTPVEPNDNTLVIFRFTDNTELHFFDPSFVGCFHLRSLSTYKLKDPIRPRGSIAKRINHENLYNMLYKKNKSIKWALKVNDFIIGIGNIYADEILHRSKVHPFTSCKKIGKEDIRKIVVNAQEVLDKATFNLGSERKSIIDPALDIGLYSEFLLAYNQVGKKCTLCNKSAIEKIVGNNNEISYICKICQIER